MNNTIFFIPDAVGKLPSRSAPVDRIEGLFLSLLVLGCGAFATALFV
jgi:hypothetical protein